MNTAHFAFKLRKDRPKNDGTLAIYLYANINGKISWYTTNRAVTQSHWNDRKQEVRASAPDWKEINSHLHNFLVTAKNYISQSDIDGQIAKSTVLDKHLRSSNIQTQNYFQFVETYISKYSGDYAPKTIKGFKSHVNKLRAFRANVQFLDIDPVFWKDYESYLKGIRNHQNALHKEARYLKKFINKAIEFGAIRENQLKEIRVKSVNGNREYLTKEEVSRLQQLYDSDEIKNFGLRQVLRYFLFACYTSLRYGDVKELRYKNLSEETINIEFQKTGKRIKIPLSNKAKSLLDPETIPNGKVFRAFENQVTNRYLKQIMKLAGINKEISFHCARHTWATITLELTGDIALVSNVLGHSSIKTTQIYAKIVEQRKKEAMNLWDEF